MVSLPFATATPQAEVSASQPIIDLEGAPGFVSPFKLIEPPPAGQALGSILMYHYVRTVDPSKDPLGYRLSVTDSDLDAEIQALQRAGYHSISIDDLESGKGSAHSVALTFDDGYEDFYTDALPILQKYGWHATLYIITGKVGLGTYLTWDQIKTLDHLGFEIGAHTVDHRDLATQTPDAQYHEIFDSKATLQSELAHPVTAFCYPSGRYDAVTLSLVRQAGYTSATTTTAGIAKRANFDPFQLPRLRIQPPMSPATILKELPN